MSAINKAGLRPVCVLGGYLRPRSAGARDLLRGDVREEGGGRPLGRSVRVESRIHGEPFFQIRFVRGAARGDRKDPGPVVRHVAQILVDVERAGTRIVDRASFEREARGFALRHHEFGREDRRMTQKVGAGDGDPQRRPLVRDPEYSFEVDDARAQIRMRKRLAAVRIRLRDELFRPGASDREEGDAPDGPFFLPAQSDELEERAFQTDTRGDDVGDDPVGTRGQDHLFVAVFGDIPPFPSVERALRRDECRVVPFPAVGGRERFAQAEVETSAEDVQDDGVAFFADGLSRTVERGKDPRHRPAEEPRVRRPEDEGIVADRARIRRGRDEARDPVERLELIYVAVFMPDQMLHEALFCGHWRFEGSGRYRGTLYATSDRLSVDVDGCYLFIFDNTKPAHRASISPITVQLTTSPEEMRNEL